MNKELKKLLNYVKESTDLNQLQIAEELGMNPRILSDLVNGRKSDAYIERTIKLIKEKFNIGNMDEVVDNAMLPFFDEEIFTGGYLQGIGAPISLYQKIDDIKLPFLKVKDGDFAVQVHGRSMIDTEHPELSINDGAIICLRPWTESFIAYGERYAIATSSGFTVKYIAPSEDNDTIKCVPANKGENFAPFYINKVDVKGIARVTAIINLQIL